MEGFIYLFIILFAFLFLVFIPLWISLKINKFLRKKGIDSKISFVAFSPILITIILVYFSFYPTDSHYINIYNQVTKNNFPENAQFISKYSANPTFIEGWTLMMIKLNKKDYVNLKSELKNLNYEIEIPTKINDLRGQFDVKDFFVLKPNLQIDTVLFTKPELYVYYGVAFMDDGETIIVKKII